MKPIRLNVFQGVFVFQQLMDDHDFLAFTLANIDKPLKSQAFTLSNQTTVTILDNGVISFSPASGSTKDVVLSCAIHGNETAPIEICNKLISDLLTCKIETLHRVLFIIGNPDSILTQTRFVEENMNRLFSGAHSDGEGLINKERVRAKALEQYVSDFSMTMITRSVFITICTLLSSLQSMKSLRYIPTDQAEHSVQNK